MSWSSAAAWSGPRSRASSPMRGRPSRWSRPAIWRQAPPEPRPAAQPVTDGIDRRGDLRSSPRRDRRYPEHVTRLRSRTGLDPEYRLPGLLLPRFDEEAVNASLFQSQGEGSFPPRGLSARGRPRRGRPAGAAVRPGCARSLTRPPARTGWQRRGNGSSGGRRLVSGPGVADPKKEPPMDARRSGARRDHLAALGQASRPVSATCAVSDRWSAKILNKRGLSVTPCRVGQRRPMAGIVAQPGRCQRLRPGLRPWQPSGYGPPISCLQPLALERSHCTQYRSGPPLPVVVADLRQIRRSARSACP